MAQAYRTQDAQESSRYPVHTAAIALRGIGQMCDMNLEAARLLLHTQARAAAVFGWPDISELFDPVEERARHAFSAGTEQMLNAAQRASEAATQLQRQITRVVENQAVTAAENWQRGIEELGAQAGEGLNQLCDSARQQADEAQRMTEQLAKEARVTLERGSTQVRGAVQEATQKHKAAA